MQEVENGPGAMQGEEGPKAVVGRGTIVNSWDQPIKVESS